MTKNYLIIDKDTGEIINEITTDSNTRTFYDVDNNKIYKNVVSAAIKTKDMIEAEAKTRQDTELKTNRGGDFFFLTFNEEGKLKISETDITSKYLFRVMFLATFLNYSNELYFNERNKMTKSNMNEVLGIPTSEFSRFYSFCIEHNIIIDNGEILSLNPDYIFLGKVQKKVSVVKVYTKSVKEFYSKVQPTDHKTYGYLYYLLPALNRNYNIFSDINENDIDKLSASDINKLSELVGIDKRTLQKMFDSLSQITIKNIKLDIVTTTEEPIIKFVNYNSKKYIGVNPQLASFCIFSNYEFFCSLPDYQN